MALKKEVILENGIITGYHRIVSINKITNNSTIIEIASYISEEKREEEKERIKNNEEMNIFINTTYINTTYNENTNIEDCYSYLKTTDMFKGSEDI